MFSRSICITAAIVAGIVFSANVSAEADSAPKVSAREPLTYRNMGLYATWEAPEFDFVIVRSPVIRGKDKAADLRLVEAWSENLVKARAKNKRVIVDVLWQHWGMEKELNFQAVDAFLSHVDVDEIYAITLGEEHIFWDGRHEMLVDLYNQVKEKFPDLPVYQWYSPTFWGTDWPGFTWPWLPADGWVVDEYHAIPMDFEQNVRHHLMLDASEVDIQLAGGEVLEPLGGLKVIHTPGRTPGSISLYSAQNRLLIVGDALVKRRRSPQLPLKMVSTNPRQAIDSVREMVELDFDILCFGHGRPLTEGARTKLLELVKKTGVDNS